MTDPQAPHRADRREVAWAAAIGLSLAMLYAMTLCPTVYWYDSAEFAAHAAGLGVPHPPGYPLYTMIAHVFTWLPGEAALGVNIMSAVFGVLGAVMLYRLGRRLGARPAGATLGAMLLGTGFTYWNNAVVAEVYTPGLVFTLGALLLLIRADERESTRPAVLAGLVGGLGMGMHMSIATFGLAYVWLLLTHAVPLERLRDVSALLTRTWPRRLRVMVLSGLAAVSGLMVFAYVPFASFERWDAREWTIFRKNLTGGAFKRKMLKEYDFGERFDLTWDILVNNLELAGLGLAAVGLLALLRRRPKLGVAVFLAAAGNLWWFFNYKVPDLDVFYLPAIACLCLLAGQGMDALVVTASQERSRALDMGWLALVFPAWFVWRNYETVDLSEATEARAWGNEVCENIRGRGRVVNFSTPNEWRYYAVLLYQQEALGRCKNLEIWGKRDIDHRQLRVAVHRGDPIYAFVQIGRLRLYDLEAHHGLYRVYPRSSAAKRRIKQSEAERAASD